MRENRSVKLLLSPLMHAAASLLTIGCVVATARGAEGAQRAAADRRPIDFAHEVVPILQKRCAKCHAGTQKKGGFSINTRQSFLAGGDEGPAVVPRKSAES